jgi:hypothetical protein
VVVEQVVDITELTQVEPVVQAAAGLAVLLALAVIQTAERLEL